MPSFHPQKTHRRIKIVFGLVLVAVFYAEFTDRDHKPVLNQRSAIVLAGPQMAVDPVEKMMRESPLDALLALRAEHIQQVRDYRCSMVKQELLPSGMSAEQEMEVKFRQQPFSVEMHWVRNPGSANRVIYIAGRWTDESEKDPQKRALAVCQPGGVMRKLLKSIRMPIRGFMAKRTARRSIDEFGFKRTLDLLIKYCELAKSRDELQLDFRGETHFDGRPVWVVRRRLPYKGEDGPYPDRTAQVFIDKEYRVPVAVYCYSDDAMKPENLLGKYEYRNVRFNVGLTDADFDPSTYGM